MKFCTNCGIQLEDAVAFCPSCGTKVETVVEPTPVEAPAQSVASAENIAPVVDPVAPVEPVVPVQEAVSQVEESVVTVKPVAVADPAYVAQPVTVEAVTTNVSPTDAPSKGFFALGFFFFPVGLILYFIFKNRSPQRAKSALKGFIIGTSIYVALVIIYAVLMGVIAFLAAEAATSSYYYY